MGVDHLLLKYHPVTDPEGCYHLGEYLSGKGFRKHQQDIVEHLTMDPLKSLEAAIHWKDERYTPHASRIALAISKSPTASLLTHNWHQTNSPSLPDDRFFPFADLYAASVATDNDAILRAGMFWPDKRFNPYSTLFLESMAPSPTALLDAAIRWEPARSEAVINAVLETSPLDESTLIAVRSMPAKSRLFMIGLMKRHGIGIIRDIPYQAFSKLADAYHFATQAGSSEALESFEENLPIVIAEGTVLPWSQTIINHFRGKAIGGGHYREIHEGRRLLEPAHLSPDLAIFRIQQKPLTAPAHQR